MPLARGTAAVGYTTMLGLFWAAGMPVSSIIPKDYQVCVGGCGCGCACVTTAPRTWFVWTWEPHTLLV